MSHRRSACRRTSPPAPRPSASLRPRLSTVSIMPGIEARAPERTETSSGFFVSPKILPVSLPTCASAFSTCAFRSFGYCLLVGVIVGADLGGDGEAGRHRQAEARHFGKARALAAEQIARRAFALGLAVAEEIDPLALLRRLGRRRRRAFTRRASSACAFFFFAMITQKRDEPAARNHGGTAKRKPSKRNQLSGKGRAPAGR